MRPFATLFLALWACLALTPAGATSYPPGEPSVFVAPDGSGYVEVAMGDVIGGNSSNVSIPDNGSWVSSTISINSAPSGATVTGIDVAFAVVHPYSGDLVIDLNADASGSQGNVRLWDREGGSSDDPERGVNGIDEYDGLSVNRTWYLYARDYEAGDAGYIDTWVIRVYFESAAPLEPPTPTSPGAGSAPGETITDLTPRLRWDEADDVDRYGLYISRAPYGSSNIVYSREDLTGSSHTVQSGVLAEGEAYRWNMVSFRGGEESGVSDALYFQYEASQPDLEPPTLVGPGSGSAPGQTLTDLTPRLRWNAVATADRYGLYVSRAPYGSSNIVYESESVTGTEFTVPSGVLAEGEAYRWNMVSFRGGEESSVSDALYFQYEASQPDLEPPTLVGPGSGSAPGETLTDLTPSLRWDGADDVDRYGLYISRAPYGSSNIVYSREDLTGSSHTVQSGVLAEGEAYRWNMVSFRGGEESGVSGPLYFQYDGVQEGLAPPGLVSPGAASSPGPTLSDPNVTFQWTTSSGADGYWLYIRDIATNQLREIEIGGGGTTSRTVALNVGARYRWNMTAYGSAGESDVSETWYFRTDSQGGEDGVAYGFDYPIGDRGVTRSGDSYELPEQVDPEQNTLYPFAPRANPDRGRLSGSGWRNVQDVGSFLPASQGGGAGGGIHSGEDWNIGSGASDAGELVYAVANGAVVRVTQSGGTASGSGYTVILEHTLPNGATVYSLYLHVTDVSRGDGTVSPPSLSAGERVARGEPIARIGRITGFSPHLHFEIREGSGSWDPYGLQFPNSNGGGYYTHDNQMYESMTASQVGTAFQIMRGIGIVDPSDFIDANRLSETGGGGTSEGSGPDGQESLRVLSVSPNPSAGPTARAAIASPTAASVSYAVVDMLGRVVWSGSMSARAGTNVLEIPVARMSRGVYALLVTGPEGTATRRFNVAR